MTCRPRAVPARHGAGKCSYRCVIVRDRARRDEHHRRAGRVRSRGRISPGVQGVYSGGAGRWEENCLPAGSGGAHRIFSPVWRHERHRTRRKEYAGERIEPGAVTESLQGIQGGIGGRVAGDRRDGFMHRLDRLAPRTPPQGGAALRRLVRRGACRATVRASEAAMPRSPNACSATSTPARQSSPEGVRPHPAPRRSTAGRGDDAPPPCNASPIHRSRAGTARTKRVSAGPGSAGASIAWKCTGSLLQALRLETQGGDTPSTCGAPRRGAGGSRARHASKRDRCGAPPRPWRAGAVGSNRRGARVRMFRACRSRAWPRPPARSPGPAPPLPEARSRHDHVERAARRRRRRDAGDPARAFEIQRGRECGEHRAVPGHEYAAGGAAHAHRRPRGSARRWFGVTRSFHARYPDPAALEPEACS